MTNCASFPLVSALKGDLVGEWLPLALADLYMLIYSIGGNALTRDEVLQSWGFAPMQRPAAQIKAETDRALSQLFPTLLHQQQKQEVVRRQPISLVGPMQRNEVGDQDHDKRDQDTSHEQQGEFLNLKRADKCQQ